MIFDGIDQAVNERVFYELLVRVGAIGKYQYISLLVLATIFMVTASVLFYNPLLFYQAPYNCPGLTPEDCYSMVCSLPDYLRINFVNQDIPTFLDKFGDYRCDNTSMPKYAQSIIYVAGMVGILIGTYLNSFFRKKLLVEGSLIMAGICYISVLFVKDFTAAVVIMSINFACQTVLADLAVCFITETVHEDKRDSHMLILFIFFSLGAVFNGVLFKLFYWQQIFVYYFIGLTVLTIVGLLFYVKETPFDLVTCFPPEEAYKQLHWIAIQNGNEEKMDITLQQLRIMRADYDESLRSKQKLNIHVLDLFRFDSLRKDTILFCVFHFFIYYNYATPILGLDQFTNDIYLNDIFFSLAALGSSIMCYFFVQFLPRKKMVYYSIFASQILIIPLFFSATCHQNCETIKTVETVSMVLYRIILEISYQAFYFMQNEIFPTQIRSLAILLTAIACNLVPVFVPLINVLNASFPLLFPSTFIVAGFIVILVTTQIRETLNVPPPEIIEQLFYKSSKRLPATQ